MSFPSQNDSSTLAALMPTQEQDLHFKNFKNSMRYQGSHLLALRRPTKLPAASRKYVFGDPVKFVDWKAFARSDQLIIRDHRDEAAARVRIFCDASATMLWPDETVPADVRERVPKKFELAMRIALNLAHGHLRAGDDVEIILAGSEALAGERLALRLRSPRDVVSFFSRADASKFDLKELIPFFVPAKADYVHVDVGYWVGDGLASTNFTDFFAKSHTGFMLQTLSSLETNTEWMKNATTYFDEDLGKKEYLGQVLRSGTQYRAGLKHWLDKIHRDLAQNNVAHTVLTEESTVASYQIFLSTVGRRF